MIAFISYRREDSQPFVDRINEWLVRRIGHGNVFRDIDSIPLGRDFRRAIFDKVGRCDVLLAVIGRTWLTATNAAGVRRVSDPSDYVRLEIEAGLQRNIPIIPLLVNGAAIPRESDLPPSLKPLAYRQGIPVRNDPDFNRDMERLLIALPLARPLQVGGGSGRSVFVDDDLPQAGCGGAGGQAFGFLFEDCSGVTIDGDSITDIRGGQGGDGIRGGAGGDAGAIVFRGKSAGVKIRVSSLAALSAAPPASPGAPPGVARQIGERNRTAHGESGSREALLLPRPLRTGRESCPSSSSSLHKRPLRDAAAFARFSCTWICRWQLACNNSMLFAVS